ncbi:DNA-binding protein RFX8 [Eudromia elegans]
MYIENCSQNVKNQVNPATFGKLVRLVFPGLGTRRLGTRGSARYHYDGIYVKRSSSFYARYCSLLGDACSAGDAAGYKSNSQKQGTNEDDSLEYSLPEFRRFYSWEQELGKNHPYELVALLADEYCSYCQDILQNVRREELDKVEDCIVSFWKSLQPETTALLSLPDVCQLFTCYDRQLFKEMENILLNDFLEDVSIQYLKSIRMFSKSVKVWLLNALQEFPLLLRKSKFKEVTVFVKRLRRKTYLSNMAKTMRIVLNNNSKVTVLKSDLHAVIDQGFVDIHGDPFQKKFKDPDELENNIELKCNIFLCLFYPFKPLLDVVKVPAFPLVYSWRLNDLITLLDNSTDIRIFLNCLSSNLQAFVIQPSRSREELKKVAANFQLRWNFLLTGVSKAMTLCRTVSFGSWHLFHLLLLEYVAHIFQSHLEEEGDENLCVIEQSDSTVLLVHEPDHLLDNFAEQLPETQGPEPTLESLTQSQSDDTLSNIFFRVLSCLVDADTGSKLIQVMLEDRITKTSVKLDLPIGKEALVTLKDGQKFIICASDAQIPIEDQPDI